MHCRAQKICQYFIYSVVFPDTEKFWQVSPYILQVACIPSVKLYTHQFVLNTDQLLQNKTNLFQVVFFFHSCVQCTVGMLCFFHSVGLLHLGSGYFSTVYLKKRHMLYNFKIDKGNLVLGKLLSHTI